MIRILNPDGLMLMGKTPSITKQYLLHHGNSSSNQVTDSFISMIHLPVELEFIPNIDLSTFLFNGSISFEENKLVIH